ncbi:hypothetical protein Bhyg_00436 [Pseudolycoriella hygida]|uniref:Uncharacterized protein n=1 Tax=Pseudolycoriella hygida TaxID=35572 RepID=A0A9Q0S4L4_9DIPT|nr:hypothetical protein Bhyg_00436 [Pseudolycoriella hygida]
MLISNICCHALLRICSDHVKWYQTLFVFSLKKNVTYRPGSLFHPDISITNLRAKDHTQKQIKNVLCESFLHYDTS